MLESENILLRRFAATGDAEAFAEIVQRHAGLVYGASLRILADKDRAADAVQETFLQLLRNAGKITGSVPTWLHRVATRKAVDVIRRDSSRKQREAKYAADNRQQVTKWQDLSRYIDEGLDELDEQTRQILIQHFFQGRTTRDIAAGKDISQPTASRRIEAAVTQLREKLRRRGILAGSALLVALLGQNAVQAAPAVVLQELGKIALVGSQAAAAAGAGAAVSASTAAASATAASGAGAKVAVGVLAGINGKIVAAVAVVAIGVGTAVTYNNATQSPEVSPPPQQPSTQSYSPSPSIRPAPTRPAPRRTQTMTERQWSQWELETWEKMMADEPGPRPAATSFNETSPAEEPDDRQPTGGYSMGFGGYSRTPAGPAQPEEEPAPEDSNTPTASYGYGGFGGRYGGTRIVKPKQPDESDEEPPERRD